MIDNMNVKGNDAMKNIKFLSNMPDEERDQYRGEWVAVASEQIVAHGKDPVSVHLDGCKAGLGEPFLDYIYADRSELPLAYYDPDL